METIITVIKMPVITLTLMIIMVTIAKIWLNHVEFSSLGGKRSRAYQRNKIVCVALCAIGYLWLLYFSFWPVITGDFLPFISEHDWAFNLALAILIVAGFIFSLALVEYSPGLAFLTMAATWILPIIAVFLHYENDGIHFVFTTLAIIALVISEAIITSCVAEE